MIRISARATIRAIMRIPIQATTLVGISYQGCYTRAIAKGRHNGLGLMDP